MKRVLLPLIASIVLPSSVNARTVYSLMVGEVGNTTGDRSAVFEAITNITFPTYEACVDEGKRFADRTNRFWFHCFEGKSIKIGL